MVMRSTLEAEIERLTTLLSEEKKRNAEREGEFCKINAELHKEIQRRGVYAEGLEKVLLGLSMYVGAGPDPSGVMYRDIVQTYSAKAREALKAKPTASIPTGASREGVVTVREQPPKPQSVAARVGEEVRKEMAEAKAAMGEPHAARRLLGEETHEIDNEVPPGVIEAICKWMEWPLPAMEQDARDFWRCIAAAFAEGGKVSSPQRGEEVPPHKVHTQFCAAWDGRPCSCGAGDIGSVFPERPERPRTGREVCEHRYLQDTDGRWTCRCGLERPPMYPSSTVKE
jgi:hypothetical protein